MLTMTIHGADGMMVRERDDVTIDEAVAEMVASGHWREIGPGDEPTAIFNSLGECIGAIEAFIDHHNTNEARAFLWSRKPEDLIAAWKRGYQTIESSH